MIYSKLAKKFFLDQAKHRAEVLEKLKEDTHGKTMEPTDPKFLNFVITLDKFGIRRVGKPHPKGFPDFRRGFNLLIDNTVIISVDIKREQKEENGDLIPQATITFF